MSFQPGQGPLGADRALGPGHRRAGRGPIRRRGRRLRGG